MKDGRPVSLKLGKCGVIRAPEMPEVLVIGVEAGDPHGPFGAKGVGEVGMVPTAAAVANAFAAFDGIRRYSLPMGARRPSESSLPVSPAPEAAKGERRPVRGPGFRR
jgi:xanthine dehydrogenase molybdenum-binding subunit